MTSLENFSSRRHLPQLDGLRGIAVLAVLAVHSPAALLFPHGWLGVDLFFALSGFLITGILLDSKGQPRYLSNFYARRALRIWPLYFLVLFLAFVVLPALSLGQSTYAASTLAWFVSYLQNLHGLAQGPPELSVTWSLAIEEQFYFIWPLAVLLLPRRKLAAAAAAIVLGSPLLRYLMLERGIPADLIYHWTFTHADGLAGGALLALAVRSPLALRREFVRFAGVLFALSSLLLAACLHFGYVSVTTPRNNLLYALSFTASALAFASAVALALSSVRVQRVLDWKLLQHTGKISYGLYVYHMFLFEVARRGFGDWLAAHPQLHRAVMLGAFWLVAFAGVFLIAELSWRFVETPILRLKARFEGARPEPPRAVTVGESVS